MRKDILIIGCVLALLLLGAARAFTGKIEGISDGDTLTDLHKKIMVGPFNPGRDGILLAIGHAHLGYGQSDR